MEKLTLSLYPTLLDSYYWYKKMGCKPETYQELIDKLNKVPQSPESFPIAAKKGVQFEDTVNSLLSGKPVTLIEDCYSTPDFVFGKPLVDKVVAKLRNAKKQQVYKEGIIDTPIGKVKVYGFVDYDYDNLIIDLKTTASYKIGKYTINTQHKAYPMLERLKGVEKDFKYFVTDFNNTYIESYKWKTEYADEFTSDIVQFYNDFLLPNKELITHPKIWGLAEKKW